MSVPYTDPRTLWALSPDAFNEWRATNDLPLLLALFRSKLPNFDDWMSECGLDEQLFCRFSPTGQLFYGPGGRKLFAQERQPNEKYQFFRPWDHAPKEQHLSFLKRQGLPIPEFREVEPYFLWAKRVLKRNRYFHPGDADQVKVDSFQFNHWTTDQTGIGRALLFRVFYVLKLGNVVCGNGVDIGRRNLDFSDLDSLVIEGRWRPSWETRISFSSARNLEIRKALIHHAILRGCALTEFHALDSELQRVDFVECYGYGARVEGCRIRGMVISGDQFFPEFETSDLINVDYMPNRWARPAGGTTDNYRKLRAAYQRTGLRREAAAAYYMERTFERRVLFNPYIEHRDRFPPMRFAGTLRDAYLQWYKRECTGNECMQRAAGQLWFHIKVWTNLKYLPRALKYKVRYIASLIDAMLWGYGERPGRVFAFALAVIGGFAVAYFVGHDRLVHFPDSARVLNAVYFSVVTFTTLGYGDILPADNGMKVICALEAITGAFTMGMVVAGFANRSRY
jgi:Ion channel